MFNQEKRILRSNEFNYSITYEFSSRAWNSRMSQLMSNIEIYDIILVSSQIWDLTRYQDHDGTLYLKNIDLLFEKLQLTGKHIIWMSTPRVHNLKYTRLYELQIKLNDLTIAKAVEKQFYILNLYQEMINQVNLQGKDGIHWSPEGHRMMTQYLIQLIKEIPLVTNSVLVNTRKSIDTISSKFYISSGKMFFRLVNILKQKNVYFFLNYTGNKRFSARDNRTSTIDRRFDNQSKRKDSGNDIANKRKMSNKDAEAFGTAFGAAWRKLNFN